MPPRRTRAWPVLALAALVLAGCTAAPEPVAPAAAPVAPLPPPAPAVVVADVGPGVNPYHAHFRRPGWDASPALRVPGMPEPVPLPLTLGDDYAASRAADEALWEAFEPQVLYWVPGTNLLLFKDRPFYNIDPLPDGGPRTFHGTGSAAAVAAACPGCYVLVYMDGASIDGAPIARMAEEMPWVDLGVSTNIPGEAYNPLGTYDEATRAFWDAGRLFVSFAGNFPVSGFLNTPLALPIHHVDYPPWVVMVGGAHRDCAATEVLAGKPPEFVGNFTQTLPATETVDGTRTMSGTSFATPQVAGAFGAALLRVREATPGGSADGVLWRTTPRASGALDDGELTQEELRAALAAAATYFDPSSWRPGCGTHVGAPAPLPSGTPASPAPWLEMGWGFLGPEEAAVAAAVLLGEAEAPAKPPQAVAWMEAFMGLRATMYPW